MLFHSPEITFTLIRLTSPLLGSVWKSMGVVVTLKVDWGNVAEMAMNIANLSLDSIGRESSGHKQGVNKHRKSERGRRKENGGGVNVRRYMTGIGREKYVLSYSFRGEPSSLFFRSCNLFDSISKIIGRAKTQTSRTSLNTISTRSSPYLFFCLMFHPLYYSVSLCSPFIHSYYG